MFSTGIGKQKSFSNNYFWKKNQIMVIDNYDRKYTVK